MHQSEIWRKDWDRRHKSESLPLVDFKKKIFI